jgi:hypothetical protein
MRKVWVVLIFIVSHFIHSLHTRGAVKRRPAHPGWSYAAILSLSTTPGVRISGPRVWRNGVFGFDVCDKSLGSFKKQSFIVSFGNISKVSTCVKNLKKKKILLDYNKPIAPRKTIILTGPFCVSQ